MEGGGAPSILTRGGIFATLFAQSLPFTSAPGFPLNRRTRYPRRIKRPAFRAGLFVRWNSVSRGRARYVTLGVLETLSGIPPLVYRRRFII